MNDESKRLFEISNFSIFVIFEFFEFYSHSLKRKDIDRTSLYKICFLNIDNFLLTKQKHLVSLLLSHVIVVLSLVER